MWLTSLLLACTGEPATDVVTDTGGSQCDDRYQPGDGDGVDAVFDRDQDGYMDQRDASCVANYGPNRLDCDDDDPSIHPDALEIQCNEVDEDCNPDTLDALDGDGDGTPSCFDCDDNDPLQSPIADETCWDGVDNDCDTIVDNDCGPDYGGRFVLSEQIRYTCLIGLVNINFDEVGVLYDPPYASMYSVNSGQPGTMQGTVYEDGTFDFSVYIDIKTEASCAESYRVTGQFLDEDNLTLDFEARFIPTSAGACLGCVDRTWNGLTGVRSN